LHETVDPLVAAHDDMSDRIKPQARSFATADASIKQIDISRDISKDWIERLVEKLEPRHLRIVQLHDDAGALRRFNTRDAQRIPQSVLGFRG
jgi:Fe-S-cluster formation regulator IscX/YfhJ